ncbi:MAG: YtxH domain-containing protein [Vampirovibrionales bacterium]|nr:YtxH domain-containing protein [Vampirovibrionales bacterium]
MSAGRGFWLGLMLGAVGALLLAPSNGKAFRGAVKKGYATLCDDLENPYGRTRGLFDEARFRLERQVELYKAGKSARRLARAKARETRLESSLKQHS